MATIKDPKITVKPVEKENTTTTPDPNMASKELFGNLQQSFVEKCKQNDELATAYRNLQMRYITDSESAKAFIKAAMLGLNLLFPNNNKGGRD